MQHLHTLLLIIVASGIAAPVAARTPDFADQIAPIIHQRCAVCHREGQSAPFALLTTDEIQERAETILAVVQDGYMPPWKPVNDQVHYANDRRLTENEKRLLVAWVQAGAPADNTAPVEPPVFPGDWTLGQPDLVLKMKEPFPVPASGPDIYRSFMFPVALPSDRWVKAIEVRPSARGVVHHALFFVDPTGRSRQLDGQDGKPGFRGMSFLRRGGSRPLENLSGLSLGGYVPGAMPNRLPGDLAMKLPAGSDIVMQTHFHPSGRAVQEQSELGIYLTDQAPSRQLTNLQLPPIFGRFAGIDIPAGDAHYRIQDSMTLPVDVQAIGVSGHAHYLCREMEMRATLPNGHQLPLLTIRDWDLDWQDQYLFAAPLSLPAGTRLQVTIIYDNSEENPENPFSPPRRVRWGRESTDEMGSMTLQVVAQHAADQEQLQAANRQQVISAVKQQLNGFTTGASAGLFGGRLRRLLMRRGANGQIVKRLDTNKDGRLQAAELPAQSRQRLLEFADGNQDNTLDQGEIELLRQTINRLQETRDDQK